MKIDDQKSRAEVTQAPKEYRGQAGPPKVTYEEFKRMNAALGLYGSIGSR